MFPYIDFGIIKIPAYGLFMCIAVSPCNLNFCNKVAVKDLDLDRDLDRDLDKDLDFDLDRDLDRDLDFDMDLDRDLDLDCGHKILATA